MPLTDNENTIILYSRIVWTDTSMLAEEAIE